MKGVKMLGKLFAVLGLLFSVVSHSSGNTGSTADAAAAIELTKEEQAWLATHPTLRIAPDPDNPRWSSLVSRAVPGDRCRLLPAHHVTPGYADDGVAHNQL